MARRRRCNQNPKRKATQKNTTNNSLETKRERFVWDQERIMALFNCMIRRKPAGLHKHMHVLLIKYHLSKRLKTDVPINEIWNFLLAHWNMNEADKLEYQTMKIQKKDFELPQTEEWKRLIEEQGALLKSSNTNTDAMKQTSKAVISNVDLKTFKSVKIMVEKLDNESIYKLLKIK